VTVNASRVVVHPDRAAFEAGAAELITTRLAALLADHERVSLMLSGGTTPRAIYNVLAVPPLAASLPWERVDFYFGDERAVPREDPESNYDMARRALFDPLGASPGQVFRMEADDFDIEAAAERYAAQLPESIDLALLGVGADGHTASLFPGQPALDETERRVVVVRGPKPPVLRMTVTPTVLVEASEIVVLAAGSDKAEAVQRAIEGPWDPMICPAQLARRGTFVLDRAAAALLAPRP
jgi:6-phosphogluconolactonase